jgi:hypothetical protein
MGLLLIDLSQSSLGEYPHNCQDRPEVSNEGGNCDVLIEQTNCIANREEQAYTEILSSDRM